MSQLPSLQELPAATIPTSPCATFSLPTLANRLMEREGRVVLTEALTPQEERTLRDASSTLTRMLSSGGHERRQTIAKELAYLTGALPAQGEGVARAAAYVEAMAPFPAWAVSIARARIISGGTPYGKPFCPTPPELAELVREIIRPYEDDLARVNQLLAVPAMAEVDPAMRERVGAGLRGLADELRGRQPAEESSANALERLKDLARSIGLDESAVDSLPDRK